MWRKCSCRFLSRVTQSSKLSSAPLSAHLGFQRSRLQGPRFAFHAFLSAPDGFSSPRFTTAAEAAAITGSAADAAVLSENQVEAEPWSADGPAATSAPPSLPVFEGKQDEGSLSKIIAEQRQLMDALRAELESHKTLMTSILDEIRVLKSKTDTEIAESKSSGTRRPLLEWNAFMEHLEDSGYFKDRRRAPPSNGSSSSASEDPACVSRAIHRFAQAHESIFGSLSQIDLRILARYGCASNDPNVAASQERLRQHFHLKDIAPSEDACSKKLAATQPKLVDVMRLLHSTIIEGTSEEDLRSCISHLLRELVTISMKPNEASSPSTTEATILSGSSASLLPCASDVTEVSKPDKVKCSKEKMDGQKADIMAGEERMNLGKTEATQDSPARSLPQWKCPRCSFMNLDTKHRCVECSRRRPQRTYADDMPKNTDDASLVEEDTDEDSPLNNKQAMKERERKGSKPSLGAQGHASSKAHSPQLAAPRQYDTDDETDEDVQMSSDEDATRKDPFDMLDDILESDDSDKEGRSAELSDESKAESGSRGKKCSLSSPFPREQRSSFGRSRRGGSYGRRYEDDGDSRRSRRGFVGGDEEEGSFDDTEPPSNRGFGSRDGEDYPRRYGGRGGHNGLRRTGGARGYRGEPNDDRYGDGGPRGNRGYGDRDRGSRSWSFGGRPSRRRPRY